MAELWREILAEARLAESAGFDGCVLAEHHQQPLARFGDAIHPDHLILRLRHPGATSHAQACAGMRVLGERVPPRL